MATAALPARKPRYLKRTRKTGIWSWIVTVDHKRIGLLYGGTAFFFFLIGGLEAEVIRLQLARPNGHVVSAETYNMLFTMHGLTMIFLMVMPMGVALMNYIVPLQIGARDVAFPRLNAFSYWVFLFGGLFLYSSFLLGGAPNGGWFGYAPLSSGTDYLIGNGMTYYSLGLQMLGIASLAGAVNFIVTILNMRAPGMTLMRMPLFTWMSLVTSFLLLFAMPVIAVALFELMFDRLFGANFFNVIAGGSPLLWQHLFWLFGHPEVYIMILPAMGVVSDVIPTFSGKPLFGYPAIVFAGIAIGFMGWGVWAHHMFAVGLGPVANTAFTLSTMFIAVPTGVKIFNWLGTMWGGSLRFKTPMLFAIGFVTMFVIGGLSGVTHAVVPSDYEQTDTYYVVAHFHYVLFGGSIFGLFAGLYYWWPKFFGRMLSEGLGKVHFWLMLIGFNLTFGPMHIVGLQGMPRRIPTYPGNMGWNVSNLIETVGAIVIAVSMLVFLANVIRSRKNEAATADPWDGRTVEWMTETPVPEYNFAEIPVITSRDELWHRKYVERPDKTPSPVIAGGEEEELPEDHARDHGIAGIHLPSGSYMPVIAAVGLPLIGYGLIYFAPLGVVGVLLILFGFFGWVLEPQTVEEGY